jgi:hypothetical protein
MPSQATSAIREDARSTDRIGHYCTPKRTGPAREFGVKIAVVIRPWIKVARPRDWTGALARLAMVGLGIMLGVVVLLVRLPARWVELAFGAPELVRLGAFVVLLWWLRWVAALVYARLPAAASLFRRLSFRERGRRRRVRIDEILAVHVELRPPPIHQVFVVELRDGSMHDVCPTDWPGAGPLYAKLERKVARARRKAAREAASGA